MPMELSPNAAVTRLGNVLVILLIALIAIWLANRVSFFKKIVGPKTA